MSARLRKYARSASPLWARLYVTPETPATRESQRTDLRKDADAIDFA
jgi:hypothetical protein